MTKYLTIEELLSSDIYPKKTILEKLLMHSMQLSKEDLFINMDKEIPKDTKERIIDGYNSYTIDKKPLEYILGYVEFLGVRFIVNQDTLIPRPETEYMIEAINEYISASDKKYSILDVWTWSWVLGLSVLYHNQSQVSEVLLSEYYTNTLELAKRNHSILFESLPTQADKVDFIEASLLEHKNIEDFLKLDDLILVANLPYIPEQAFEENTDDTVKKREPKPAFVGGDDGLKRYRDMFDQLIAYKSSPVMFLEMMTRQCEILREEYKKYFNFSEVKTFHFNIRILRVDHT